MDGKYSIKAKPGDVLVISFTGYDDKSVTVGSANSYNVAVREKAEILGEVLVQGAVGIKKKKDAVTATSQTIGNSELKLASNPSVVSSLVGKVSGLTINSTSNGVGGGNSIRVRSMLSVGGNTEALVVIDDVISSADVLAALPPDAVTNVTVLKGAQGAALYGSQGKSGVIIVSTKKGTTNEKLTVSITSSIDAESISFLPKMQDKYGQGWFGTFDKVENGGWGELFDGSIRDVGLVLPDGTQLTTPYSFIKDNAKGYYKQGQIFQNNVNVNVGGADAYANLNIGSVKRDFMVPGDNSIRNTVIFNGFKRVNKLALGGTFTFINSNTHQSNTASTLQSLLQAASNVPIDLFDNGTPYGYTVYYKNPFWARDNNRLNQKNNFINAGINAGYDLSKNISLSYRGSVQLRNNNQISYSTEQDNLDEVAAANADVSQASSFYQSNFTSTFYYGDIMANFNYELNKNLSLKFNVGQNMQYNYSNRISQGGKNLDVPGWYNIQNVKNPDLPNTLRNVEFDDRNVAYFANADLAYKDYLFFNATLRVESNSKLPGVYYKYPSAGVSFVPTKAFESLKQKSTFNYLKIFANATRVGSVDPINTYALADVSGLAAGYPYPVIGNSYNDFTTRTNPNIEPEIYTTIEAGANFGFFNNKLTFDASFYQTTTKNLITSSSLSTSTGLTNLVDNVGELKAKGVELDLGFSPIKNKNFSWTGRASFTSYDTKVTKVSDLSDQVVIYDISEDTNINASIVALQGESFPYIVGTDLLRDDNGNVIVNSTTGAVSEDATFKKLGKVTPDYILGLTNTFNYKGIGLSFAMDYRTGNHFISESKYELTWSGKDVSTVDWDRATGTILPGSVIANPASPGTYLPNTTVLTGGNYTDPGNNKTQVYYTTLASTGANNLIDGTALKVREISLSYSLPATLITKTGLSGLKFSLNARNPFIIFAKDNRYYSDPEASSQYNGATENSSRRATGNTSANGIGFSQIEQYPSSRTYGFSINATF
jgi:TonB-linked SusC/RagA family outer membrane protein